MMLCSVMYSGSLIVVKVCDVLELVLEVEVEDVDVELVLELVPEVPQCWTYS